MLNFYLVNSFIIKCSETYDDDYIRYEWEGIILVSDNGTVIGISNYNDSDERQLIIGKYKEDKSFQIELYKFFEEKGMVYLYNYPSEYSTQNDVFGSFSVFGQRSLGGLGDCAFELEEYKGTYSEIVEFYEDTISKIKEQKDFFKISIISDQLLNSNKTTEFNDADNDKTINVIKKK